MERNETYEMLRNYFHLPMMETCNILGISMTLLKKYCRSLGIGRWPYRKILKIDNEMKRLQEIMNDTTKPNKERETSKKELEKLEQRRNAIMIDANTPLNGSLSKKGKKDTKEGMVDCSSHHNEWNQQIGDTHGNETMMITDNFQQQPQQHQFINQRLVLNEPDTSFPSMKPIHLTSTTYIDVHQLLGNDFLSFVDHQLV